MQVIDQSAAYRPPQFSPNLLQTRTSFRVDADSVFSQPMNLNIPPHRTLPAKHLHFLASLLSVSLSLNKNSNRQQVSCIHKNPFTATMSSASRSCHSPFHSHVSFRLHQQGCSPLVSLGYLLPSQARRSIDCPYLHLHPPPP